MTVQAVPGVYAGRPQVDRPVLVEQEGKDQHRIIGITIDGAAAYDGKNTGYEKEIRGGNIMARNSSTGLWVPIKRTRSNGAGTSSTTLVVDNSGAFKAGESITVGNNAAQVIVAVTQSTNTITLTSAISWLDDAPVYVAGQDVPRGILFDSLVSLWNWDKTAYVNKHAVMITDGGIIVYDNILGDITASVSDAPSANDFWPTLKVDKWITGEQTRPPLPNEIQQSEYLVENLSAGADLADIAFFMATAPATILGISIVPQVAATGIDNSNTSLWLVERAGTTTSVATKTYNATTVYPGAGVMDSLGTISNAKLQPGQGLQVSITNGATADLGAVKIYTKYRFGIEG